MTPCVCVLQLSLLTNDKIFHHWCSDNKYLDWTTNNADDIVLSSSLNWNEHIISVHNIKPFYSTSLINYFELNCLLTYHFLKCIVININGQSAIEKCSQRCWNNIALQTTFYNGQINCCHISDWQCRIVFQFFRLFSAIIHHAV